MKMDEVVSAHRVGSGTQPVGGFGPAILRREIRAAELALEKVKRARATAARSHDRKRIIEQDACVELIEHGLERLRSQLSEYEKGRSHVESGPATNS